MEQALQEISFTPDILGKTFVLSSLGLVLLAMNDASGAFRHFSEAYELASSHELTSLAWEVTIYLASCKIMQGQPDAARKYIHEAWDYIKDHDWTGLANPGGTYFTCAEVFDALGETENFLEVLEIANKILMEVADAKNIPEWRQAFLENVPEHRALIELWERNKR
jgi:tetratricopeptide (TPR) repeat protein